MRQSVSDDEQMFKVKVRLNKQVLETELLLIYAVENMSGLHAHLECFSYLTPL